MKIKINDREIEIREVKGIWKYVGLMFKFKRENLLFDFGKDVRIRFHSLFVFYPFLIIWLDSKNNVIEMRKVKPFCFSILPSKGKVFRRVLEIPLKKEKS